MKTVAEQVAMRTELRRSKNNGLESHYSDSKYNACLWILNKCNFFLLILRETLTYFDRSWQ
jgi:hypothetical protein